MAWTAPRTWANGALAAADMNVDIRDNTDYLKDALDLHGMTSDTTRQNVESARGFTVKALRTATQTISDSVNTDVQFTAADIVDSDAMHDPASNSERLTIPSGGDGDYLVGQSITFAASASGSVRVQTRQNGSVVQGSGNRVANETGEAAIVNNVDLVTGLAAGDYITANVRQTSGGNLNVTEAIFWAYRIFKS